jgi:hypothetical protein
MSLEIDHLRSWIGREEVAEEVITSVPGAALAATLDRDDPKPQIRRRIAAALALTLLPAQRRNVRGWITRAASPETSAAKCWHSFPEPNRSLPSARAHGDLRVRTVPGRGQVT